MPAQSKNQKGCGRGQHSANVSPSLSRGSNADSDDSNATRYELVNKSRSRFQHQSLSPFRRSRSSRMSSATERPAPNSQLISSLAQFERANAELRAHLSANFPFKAAGCFFVTSESSIQIVCCDTSSSTFFTPAHAQ
ncbi:hypothetical protein BV898_17578 [Hypsibius exemplaris]|uniref:Uncharacterized protein n=1 Tax=Hypsibius exemplaris TaxID=2072580 RepID=A0A9X6NHH4_HYPEX|nr:hypothetical protein BV898_17578 [Hypsibius exemplaris]